MASSPEQMRYMEEHPNDSLQPNIIAAAVVGLSLAWTAIVLRFVARYKSKLPFGSDDWLIVAAGLCYIPVVVGNIYGDHGKHIIYVKSVRTFVVTFVAAITSYSIATTLTKFSILFLYCRIFPGKVLKKVVICLCIFIAAYNLAMVLVTSLMCIPLSSAWNGQPGKCINLMPPFLTLGIVNVVTDIVILAIPIRFVTRLQMSRLQKIQVCGIFLTGALVCVFGVVRVVALATAASGDLSYNEAWSCLCSGLEATIGIVAACLPTMGLFFAKAKSFTFSLPLPKWAGELVSRFTTQRNLENPGSASQSDSGEKLVNTQWCEVTETEAVKQSSC